MHLVEHKVSLVECKMHLVEHEISLVECKMQLVISRV